MIDYVSDWGHSEWANPQGAWCISGLYTQHGPDGPVLYDGHTAWAHGGIWAYVGKYFSIGCLPVTSTYWHDALRLAGNGYWDGYYDY